MRDWLTPAEIAKAALPDLPETRRGVELYIARAGWSGRLDKWRHGKKSVEYHVSLLPDEALAAFMARALGVISAPRAPPHRAEAAPKAAPDAKNLTGPALENRDARMALLAAANKFAQKTNLVPTRADYRFATLYNLGKIPVADWIRRAAPRLSATTLARWRRLGMEAPARLGVDRGAARRGKSFLETAEKGAVRRVILAAIAARPHLTADHVRDYVGARFPSLALPAVRVFQRYLKALKKDEKMLLTHVSNPDLFKSKFRSSGTGSHPVTRINELWMIDASPADALCVDGRWSIYVCIDIFSRRLIIYVSRTPRAEAVALLMRKAILAWGVPECVKTDNGSDFTAKATQRMFASLEIDVETAAPFAPEQKGHVERAIGSMQRDLLRLLPGFIGHSVADRKIIEQRKAYSARLGLDDAKAFCVELSGADLQADCDRWALNRHAHRPHGGLDGATPFAIASAYTGKLRRIEDVHALDLLLAPIAGGGGLRIVTKTGLRVNGSHYLCGSLAPGAQVLVRMDPQDMGRAYCFDPDGAAYLGEAICPELAGVDPLAAVAIAKAAQKRLLDEGARQLRKDVKAIKPRDFANAVLGRADQRAQNLVAFPNPAQTHAPAALRAARNALEAALDGAPVAPAPSEEPRKALEAAPRVHHLPETPQRRFARACALEKRMAEGKNLSIEDALWLGGYQQGPEYRAHQTIEQDLQDRAALR